MNNAASYIFLGLVVVFCVGLALTLVLVRQRRQNDLETNGLRSEAEVVSIGRDNSKGGEVSFPDFQLWVRHGSPEDSHMGWLSMSYWTVRTNFPELIEASRRLQQESKNLDRQFAAIPILVDPENPESFTVDYGRVQKKRGGFARLNEG